jgi:hypothetical protein
VLAVAVVAVTHLKPPALLQAAAVEAQAHQLQIFPAQQTLVAVAVEVMLWVILLERLVVLV